MAITDLNYDVLMKICSFVPSQRDILSLMLSCRAFLRVSKPWLLSRITLSSADQITNFCSSILRDPSELRHIKALTLKGRWLVSTQDENQRVRLCGYLAELIKAAVNLSLADICPAESMLRQSIAVSEALAGCKTLELLWLEQSDNGLHKGLGQGTCDLLRGLRAPLRTIALKSLLGNQFPDHPLDNLVCLTNTLTSLRLSIADIGDWDTIDVSWPHVIRLQIEGGRVRVAVLERAFPNLAEISVTNGLEWKDSTQQYYEANRSYRCSHAMTHLPILRGDIVGLWSLALSNCSVGLLDVQDAPINEGRIHILLEVVERTQPVILRVKILAGRQGDFFERLAQLGSRLRVLEFNVFGDDSASGYHPGETYDVLKRLAMALSPLTSLQLLRVFVSSLFARDKEHPFSLLPDNSQTALVLVTLQSIAGLGIVALTWDAASWHPAAYRAIDIIPMDNAAGPGQRHYIRQENFTQAFATVAIETVHGLFEDSPELVDIMLQPMQIKGRVHEMPYGMMMWEQEVPDTSSASAASDDTDDDEDEDAAHADRAAGL